ncbi:serine recombinase [Rhodococcus sp. WS4]|nr:serine recombinase [Rhodococcus sp. WS4]
MNAATDRQWAVRDAVLRWLLAKVTEGYRSPILDPDVIGETVGWAPSPLTRDEVADASNYLYREGYVTGVPVMGIGIPRPMLTVAGRRVAEAGRSLRPANRDHSVDVGIAT